MTKDETISITRLAAKVDDICVNAVTKELLHSEINRIDQVIKDHMSYSREAADRETSRIDNILAKNAEDLRQANEESSEATVAYAKQVEMVATTQRDLVETTRSAFSKSLSEMIGPILLRLDGIEKKQYENQGRGQGANMLWLYLLGALGAVNVAMQLLKP